MSALGASGLPNLTPKRLSAMDFIAHRYILQKKSAFGEGSLVSLSIGAVFGDALHRTPPFSDGEGRGEVRAGSPVAVPRRKGDPPLARR